MQSKPPLVPDEMIELFSVVIVLVLGLALLFSMGKLMEFINYVQS